MKNIIKTAFLLALLMISSLCSAQMFSINELLKLAEEDNDDFRNAVIENGYTYEKNVGNGLSQNYEYSTPSGNSVISLVLPSFYSDIRMLTWSFKIESAYQDLKSQLENSGYSLVDSEKRNNGKYVSLYYSRPGFDIILTSDKTSNAVGTYILSVKTTKAVYVPRSVDLDRPEPVRTNTQTKW